MSSFFFKEYTAVKVEQFHFYTCLGHSNVLYTVCVDIGIPAYPIFNECAHYTCTTYMAEDSAISYRFPLVYLTI